MECGTLRWRDRSPFSAVGPEAYLRALPPFLSKDSNEGRIRFNWRFDTPARYQGNMIRYYRLITEVDAAVGRLVDELKAGGCSKTRSSFSWGTTATFMETGPGGQVVSA